MKKLRLTSIIGRITTKLTLVSILCVMTSRAWAFNTTPRMGLLAPATGQLNYPQQFDTMFHIIDSSSAIQGFSNTFTSSNTFSGALSTVTVNQSLTLPYVGTGQCLSQGTNGVVGVSCGSSGGSSTLGVFNGVSGSPGIAVSSPTAGINFSSAVFVAVLQGPSTAYLALQGSSVTMQGNTFNGANQLIQLNGSGQIPSSLIPNSVIISTSILQSGTTFYTSSGTAINFNSSTATINTLLQVNGIGLSGTQVVGQINGSALNVAANGRIGLGTAIPAFALDEQQGTANFAFGLNTSTITVSSVTINTGGRITFGDGSVQVTAPVNGVSTLNVSSGAANNDVTVTSPTLKIGFSSQTFKVDLVGSATSFVTVNFKGAGLTSTVLATDSNGVVISTVVTTSGGPQLSSTQTWTGQNNWTTPSPSTFTYGLVVGSATLSNVASGTQCLHADSSGHVTGTGSDCSAGGGASLSSTQTWTGQNNWTTPAQSTFTYGLSVGSLTITGTGSSLGTVTSGVWNATAISAQYGGTGSNLNSGQTGAIPYFNGNGVMGFSNAPITAGQILTSGTTNTGTSPVWISSTTFILSTSTLISGSTFYVSSGTVVTKLTVPNGSAATDAAAYGQLILAGSTTTWTGTNVFSGSTSIKGTTTNNNAASGNYGEYVSSATQGMTKGSGVWDNIASITLTAGDWDVSGVAQTDPGPTTFNSEPRIALSNFSTNTTTDQVGGDNQVFLGTGITGNNVGGAIAAWRVSISSTQTYYLKMYFDYTGGTPLMDGRISARRVR